VTTALTVDRGLAGELAGDRTWRVHSMFDRVVNLEGPCGLMAVAARSVENAPRTLVVDTGDFRGHAIRVGGLVPQRDGRLRLGCLTVRTGGARLWHGRLPGRHGEIVDPRPAIRAGLRVHGRPGGAFIDETYSSSGDLITAMSVAVADGIDRLVRAASAPAGTAGSADRIRAAVGGLAGLGIGLTPSGDDVLVGAFVAGRWLGGRAGRVPDAGGRLDFSGLTTALSAGTLAAAGAGQGPQSLHALLAAIAGGDRSRIIRATAALAALGHTSGTDMTVGVLTALRLHFDQGGPR
jgi:hypothetical protein